MLYNNGLPVQMHHSVGPSGPEGREHLAGGPVAMKRTCLESRIHGRNLDDLG